MPKQKRDSKDKSESVDNEINSINAKLVLFIFGIGPIIILFLILYLNGFFS